MACTEGATAVIPAGIAIIVMVALWAWAECWPWAAIMYRINGYPGPPRTRRPGDHGPRTLHRFAVKGCTDCALAQPPPCDEHGARELAGMPRYHPERVVHGTPNPEGFAALEHLLASEDSLAQAAAAEQAARQT